MKYLYAMIAAACLAGCASVASSHYYQLHYTSQAKSSHAPYPYSVVMRTLDAPDVYSRTNIVYRASEYEVAFYSDYLWADKPARLVGNAFFDHLDRENLFREFSRTAGDAAPDYELGGELREIEEVLADSGKKASARLVLIYTLKKFDTQKVLWSQKFESEEQMPEHSPDAFLRCESEMLRDINVRAAQALDSVFAAMPQGKSDEDGRTFHSGMPAATAAPENQDIPAPSDSGLQTAP